MKQKAPSVYKQFNDWMFNYNLNSKIDDDIFRSISNMSILKILSNHGIITIKLNSVFNNFELSTLDTKEFATYIKQIISHNNISRRSVLFSKIAEKDELSKKCISKLVHIKDHEVCIFSNYIENHQDKEYILNYLGMGDINKPTKKRRTRKK